MRMVMMFGRMIGCWRSWGAGRSMTMEVSVEIDLGYIVGQSQ